MRRADRRLAVGRQRDEINEWSPGGQLGFHGCALLYEFVNPPAEASSAGGEILSLCKTSVIIAVGGCQRKDTLFFPFEDRNL
jgi:hypothetical protein